MGRRRLGLTTVDTGNIVIRVANGRRQPIDAGTRLLVTAMDGHQKVATRTFVERSEITLSGLNVQDGPADDYTVLVSAKAHTDAGFMPVRVKPNGSEVIHLMMIRRDASYAFAPFSAITERPALHDFLGGDAPDRAEAVYESLKTDNPPALACLLNITTALEQMTLVRADGVTEKPLPSFKALQSAPEQDRVFAWVDARLMQQIRDTAAAASQGLTKLAPAPKGLHPGATDSYKQTDFGEGNVQLTFHEKEQATVRGVACQLMEADIDYFKDTASHILLEVFPNKLKARIPGVDRSASLTDPRTVYGLRWIAGRRRGLDFAPPYVLQ